MYLVHLIAMGLMGSTPTTSNPDGIPFISAGLDTPAPAATTTYEPAPAPQYVYVPAPAGTWYVRAGLGLVTARSEDSPQRDIDFDDGWMASLGVGQRVGAWDTGLGFSVELDGVYASQDADDTTPQTGVRGQDALAVMVDGIADFRVVDRFSIYAGAGLGVAWQDLDTNDGFQDEDGPFFAWGAKAGLAWHFTSVTSIHLGYRFINIGSNEIDDSSTSNQDFDLDTNLHILEMGMMFGI